MKYTEQQVRDAIVNKNDAIVSEVAVECADRKLANFKIDESLRDVAIEKSIKDTIKLYKRFDTKKKWAKAIPYIMQIVGSSIAGTVWGSAKK